MFVSGNDIYVSGNQANNVAELWKNQVSLQLGVFPSSAANQVVVSGSDVFVGGAVINNTGLAVATFWKNGVSVSITDGTHDASAYALAITQN
jgi:hypothetical protein